MVALQNKFQTASVMLLCVCLVLVNNEGIDLSIERKDMKPAACMFSLLATIAIIFATFIYLHILDECTIHI